MPNGAVETDDNKLNKRQGRARRKQTIWTKEKIAKLIELYRSSDCLWNHYSELYKNKDCRAKAIESICADLGITKSEYGKKVHNLRNQFNSELKKLERRLEESGGSSAEKTCRWEHFKTLMFLRSVIEPRPGYQQGTQCKKLMTSLKFNYPEKDAENQSRIDGQTIDSLESMIGEGVELNSEVPRTTADQRPELPSKPSIPPRLAKAPTALAPVHVPCRDQWDAFGELIASEFRNLNSENSRKRLKRKIMHVMLEVGEEDDLDQSSAIS
ncbi:uncharacterized protein LOC108090983 [Drosophila ficusphila]|uniref:uncharacterized protein LOC108090983 n=1 Tax=Drosophila ficusphila TaxID=30025 RepID=UPI0007E7AF6D|nr:uncharacterized protein LOC108090983 [Drosophila ficusphila]